MSPAIPDIACVLAGGFSKRFGPENKLLAEINGMPLIHAVIMALKKSRFDRIYVVVPQRDTKLHKIVVQSGAGLILNDAPQRGQSYSLKLAAQRAISENARSMLVALGDMPFISAGHISALRAQLKTYDVVTSSDGQTQSPPVMFDHTIFPVLLTLDGDRGASAAIKLIPNRGTVQAPAGELLDIDTPEALERLQEAD